MLSISAGSFLFNVPCESIRVELSFLVTNSVIRADPAIIQTKTSFVRASFKRSVLDRVILSGLDVNDDTTEDGICGGVPKDSDRSRMTDRASTASARRINAASNCEIFVGLVGERGEAIKDRSLKLRGDDE
jgi:hypothetical protein